MRVLAIAASFLFNISQKSLTGYIYACRRDTRTQDTCGVIASAAGTSSAYGKEQHSQGMMTSFTDLASIPSGHAAPFTDQLRLAVAAYLARFKGSSREHTESDLRCYLSWCAERDLDPLAARRPHLELYIRWMQEIRRFKPSTVSRRFSVTAGFYRTCVIDGLLEHSPAEHVRRPSVPAESPTLGFTHLQFEALLTVRCCVLPGPMNSIRAAVTSGPSSSMSTPVTVTPAARSAGSVSASDVSSCGSADSSAPPRGRSRSRHSESAPRPVSQICSARPHGSSASTTTTCLKLKSPFGRPPGRSSACAMRTAVMCILRETAGMRSGRCAVM